MECWVHECCWSKAVLIQKIKARNGSSRSSFVLELVSHLEPWEPRDAVLAGVSLAPFLPRLPTDAWEALGSWQPRKNPGQLISWALTLPFITCNVRKREGLVICPHSVC